MTSADHERQTPVKQAATLDSHGAPTRQTITAPTRAHRDAAHAPQAVAKKQGSASSQSRDDTSTVNESQVRAPVSPLLAAGDHNNKRPSSKADTQLAKGSSTQHDSTGRHLVLTPDSTPAEHSVAENLSRSSMNPSISLKLSSNVPKSSEATPSSQEHQRAGSSEHLQLSLQVESDVSHQPEESLHDAVANHDSRVCSLLDR